MNDTTCLLITTFNRSNQLNNSLARLCNLTIPDEVLIVNDGGQDNCEAVVMSYKDRLPVRYIYNHNPIWSICSMARNIGVRNTGCDIIITAEPEILYMTDVVDQMLKKHQDVPGKVISAGTIYHMGHEAQLDQGMITDPIQRMQQEAVNDSGHNTNPDNPKGYVRVKGWVAPFTALYRKEWLMDINGWDEGFQSWGFDDIDLLTRLVHDGIGQEIDHNIECIHQWHEKLPPNVQWEAVQYNEQRMLAKNFDKNNPNSDIKANKDKEWGIIQH
jgi:glycosyltransferase involved in cell wall biosynthesis